MPHSQRLVDVAERLFDIKVVGKTLQTGRESLLALQFQRGPAVCEFFKMRRTLPVEPHGSREPLLMKEDRLKKSHWALLLAVLTSCQQALAAPLGCTGTIQGVIQYADGRMMIASSWRNDFTMLCNTETAWNGISTGVCTKWYALANVAYTTGKSVVVSYTDAGSATCTTLPTYQFAPPPDYLLLQPS